MLTLSATLRADMAQDIIARIDAGTGPGKIKFYDGTRPATVATAVTTQVLLGILTLSDPCGSETSGVLTLGAVTEDSSADSSGTATWFRITDSGDNGVLDGSVTATGGGGDVTLNTVTIVAGGPIQITSGTITIGGASV